MTSKRRKQEASKTNAASFRLRDVTICMERTSQPEGVRFTIVREDDARWVVQPHAVVGQITTEANGTTLCLDWWDDAIVSETVRITEGLGRVLLAIAQSTSKSAGAR